MTRTDRWTRAIAWLNEAGGPWGKGGGGSSGGGSGGSNGGGPKNPWNMPPSGGGGGGKRPGGPSAVDELMKQLNGLFGGRMPRGGDSGLVIKIAVGAALVGLLFSSFSRIAPEQQGVVTIFGKYAYTLNPGISIVPPWPVGSVKKVDVQANNMIDISANKGEQNFILTADQNVIDLGYQVRWNVKDARHFVFQLSDTETTIREIGESAMREVVGNVVFIDAMGNGRGMIERRVAGRMQQLLDEYPAGVRIQGVSIMKAGPPEQVRDAFDEVTAAQTNRQTSINNAKSYSQQVQSIAEGEASAFDRVFTQYRLAPEVTRRRMYYETMEQILSRTNKTIVEPNGVAPYLPIGKGRPAEPTVAQEPRP